MSRFSVLGFTEAELGFALAALFVAVAGYQIVTASGLETERGAVGDSLRVVREELDSLRRLSSQFAPACSERGEAEDLVARVIVLDARTLELNGQRLDAPELLRKLEKFLSISRQKRCRFYVDLVPAPGVDGTALMEARDALRRHFYFWR